MQLERPLPPTAPDMPADDAEGYAKSRRTVSLRALGVALVGAIVFGAVAALVSMRLPKTYEAGTTLLIGRSSTGSDPGYDDLLAAQLLAQTYAELATTRPILAAVASRLRLEQTPEELARSIRAEAAGVNP